MISVNLSLSGRIATGVPFEVVLLFGLTPTGGAEEALLLIKLLTTLNLLSYAEKPRE